MFKPRIWVCVCMCVCARVQACVCRNGIFFFVCVGGGAGSVSLQAHLANIDRGRKRLAEMVPHPPLFPPQAPDELEALDVTIHAVQQQPAHPHHMAPAAGVCSCPAGRSLRLCEAAAKVDVKFGACICLQPAGIPTVTTADTESGYTDRLTGHARVRIKGGREGRQRWECVLEGERKCCTAAHDAWGCK